MFLSQRLIHCCWATDYTVSVDHYSMCSYKCKQVFYKHRLVVVLCIMNESITDPENSPLIESFKEAENIKWNIKQ